ncbi:MAG: glutathione S-transferase [Sphingomonas sp. 28-66-16]|nr:MAG: glutathione S-transferase [Sphingomonas sp. 28-66-16]
MTEIILFIAPGSCSRVPTIALEEIGVPFETRVVRFMAGEHRGAAYRQYNPKGKVPALVIDGEALTENVAIAGYLNERFPDAGLLPAVSGPLDRARQTADLCFCAATLHPIVTRIRLPAMFATPEATPAVYERASLAMRDYFDMIETRLADGAWWYGDAWSVMDAYLYWVFWRVEGADFDVSRYPHFTRHARAMESRPAVQRALEREAVATAQLKEEGLVFVPPSVKAPA